MHKISVFTTPADIINTFRESVTVNFDYNNISLQISCRLLELGLTDRRERMYFDHPNPAFCRIFIFETGGTEILTAHGNFRLEPGKIYLLPSEQRFQSHYFVSRLLYFHLHICDTSEQSLFDGITGIPCLDDPALYQRFFAAFNSNDRFGLFCCFLETIRQLLRHRQTELAQRALRLQKFSQLFEVLRNSQPARINLKVLADIYNITPGSLSKRFQRTMGIPLKKYLIAYQIIQAQKLLLHSDYTIARIAELLGYGTSQYFHRFFRLHCLYSPAEYRRRSCDNVI